jgi:hypothetical protein
VHHRIVFREIKASDLEPDTIYLFYLNYADFDPDSSLQWMIGEFVDLDGQGNVRIIGQDGDEFPLERGFLAYKLHPPGHPE